MPRSTKAKALANGDIIATRELHVEGRRRKAIVTLWRPTQMEEHEWICLYRVTGMRKVRHAYGGDAFQALIHALNRVRLDLNEGKSRYTYLGGSYVGEHGFPLLVPYGFGGMKLAKRLERAIDREITDFMRAERRRRRAARRRRAPA